MNSTVNLHYLIFLSVVAALGGFLFGYDAAVISGTISQVTSRFSLDEIQVGGFVGCASPCPVSFVHLSIRSTSW